MATKETATRYLGHCQYCNGIFKLHAGKLVHHGYKRPGTGEIEGDCRGVKLLPYEVSCEDTKRFQGEVRARLYGEQEYLRKLQAGEVTEIIEISFWEKKTITHKKGDERWSLILQNRIDHQKSVVRLVQLEHERLTAMVDGWKKAPLIVEEEDLQEKRALKAKREAERTAKWRAKQARRDRIAAERSAREKTRADQRQKWRDELKAIADGPGSEAEKMRKALDFLASLRRAKYFPIHQGWVGNLEADEVLISLKLASRNDRGRVDYYYGNLA